MLCSVISIILISYYYTYILRLPKLLNICKHLIFFYFTKYKMFFKIELAKFKF